LLLRRKSCPYVCQWQCNESPPCAGGEIASTFDTPEAVKLGRCKVIEEIMIGEDKLVHFSGVALGEACTIVLRGASAPPPARMQAAAVARLPRLALPVVTASVVCACARMSHGFEMTVRGKCGEAR